MYCKTEVTRMRRRNIWFRSHPTILKQVFESKQIVRQRFDIIALIKVLLKSKIQTKHEFSRK